MSRALIVAISEFNDISASRATLSASLGIGSRKSIFGILISLNASRFSSRESAIWANPREASCPTISRFPARTLVTRETSIPFAPHKERSRSALYLNFSRSISIRGYMPHSPSFRLFFSSFKAASLYLRARTPVAVMM
ncbi:MAG TPA: hypothetical protein PKO39_07530 [Bacilli bacterium]|nr:hypothetical protein [Bacilli bacterium]HQC90335.1 hypothetical protein [Bacilli bacterium]